MQSLGSYRLYVQCTVSLLHSAEGNSVSLNGERIEEQREWIQGPYGKTQVPVSNFYSDIDLIREDRTDSITHQDGSYLITSPESLLCDIAAQDLTYKLSGRCSLKPQRRGSTAMSVVCCLPFKDLHLMGVQHARENQEMTERIRAKYENI